MTMEPIDILQDSAIKDKIVDFIAGIGLPIQKAVLEYPTFLPGIDIKNGGILYDDERLLYIGDLLHEAGHLAMLSGSFRPEACSPDNINGDMQAGGAEMGAIAWTWAALKHLEIPPEVVFHPHGYKGGADNIVQNFEEGRFFGVPILQWLGLCTEPKRDVAPDEFTFPKMKRWLRE